MKAQKITYIAHRGASYLAPENTLASIKLAWELNADAAECDIMLTKDNKVIVFHDKKGERLLNKSISITKSNYKEIKDYTITGKPSNLEKYDAETIPLLKDVLATIPEGKMLVIEIKSKLEIVAHLKKVIDTHWKTGKISFIAFDFETILKMKELYPHIPCYYLSATRTDLNAKFKQIIDSQLDGVDLNYKIIDPKLVQRFQSHNKAVWCWTVNSSRSVLRLARAGVYHITTDRPKWLKEKVKGILTKKD